MNDLIYLDELKNNISISKDNKDDLIICKDRLFISIDLIANAFDKTPTVDVVDKIATFFEKEDNWTKLKNCWMENCKSPMLRNLLTKAINDEENNYPDNTKFINEFIDIYEEDERK